MAMAKDQPPTFKHFCKICKRGFGCGRALGGHMRAHGTGDDNAGGGSIDDEENSSDWDSNSNNKHMYALRTNRNRFRSCPMCLNCGKLCKSFLENGRCGEEEDNYEDQCGVSRGKRTRSTTGTSVGSEEEDLANCLVLLSSARVDLDPPLSEDQSYTTNSNYSDHKGKAVMTTTTTTTTTTTMNTTTKGMFECKACKKSFNSHQALGGHRASHKKVKGCFAAKQQQDVVVDDVDESLVDEDVITNEDLHYSSRSTTMEHSSKRKSKVHECSVCHRIFSSGQALGGHKRCHWLTSNSHDTSTIARFHHDPTEFLDTSVYYRGGGDALDLNLLPVSTTDHVIPKQHQGHRGGDEEGGLGLEISTAICLQSWASGYTNEKKKKRNEYEESVTINVDEEVNSKVKLAKLNDVKDEHKKGNSSPWLQVGIGSTSNGGCD